MEYVGSSHILIISHAVPCKRLVHGTGIPSTAAPAWDDPAPYYADRQKQLRQVAARTARRSAGA